MKKHLQLFFSLLVALTSFTVKAQDFSATVTWNTPGSIEVRKGSSPTSATKVEIPADATSYTVTEKEEYLFIPTDGYFIESATMDGVAQNLVGWTPPKYYKIPAKYQSAKYNGKTIEIVTGEYVYDREFTLNIANGADKISFLLQDSNGNTSRELKPKDGSQVIKLSQVDSKLYMKAAGYPVPELYTATINGTPITPNIQKAYIVDLVDKAIVDVALANPSTVVNCTVTFNFVNNNPECLNNIRDWAAGKFIYPSDLQAANYTLTFTGGTQIQFNFNEDYTVNSLTANGVAVSGGTRITIEDDTEFVINATGMSYQDKEVTLYTNNAEGLSFTEEYGAAAELPLEEIADHAAGTVNFSYVGYTIPVATKQYTISGISGKTNKFFFEPKAGYWIKEGALANIRKESGDFADYYMLNGASMATVDNCPIYINVGKINYSTPAYIYYEGSDACSTKVSSTDNNGESAPYEGQLSVLPQGYTAIKFDPEYNTAFSARFTQNSTTSDGNYYVYVDGTSVSASKDSESVFDDIVLKENSVLKLFFSKSAPVRRTLNFTVDEGAEATLSYDRYITTSDFSKPIVNVGNVEYTFAPAAGTEILINGAPLAAPYTFTPQSATTDIRIIKKVEAETFDYTVTPADGATVKTLSSITLTVPASAGMLMGEESIDIATDLANYITITDGTTVYPLAGIEMGEPSDTEIPMIVSLETPATAAGNYTIDIKKGLLFTTKWDAASETFVRDALSAVNDAKTISVIVDPNYQYKWSFTPDNGSKNPLPTADDEYQFIYISLPEAESLSDESFVEGNVAGPWLQYNGVSIKKGTDETEGDWMFLPDWEHWGEPMLKIAVKASVFKTPGELTITADEGAFTVNGGEASPALDYTAQFGEKKEYNVSFNPVPGEVSADDVRVITVTFDEAETATFNGDEFYGMFSQGWSYGIQISEDDVTIEGNKIIITIPSTFNIKSGQYTLNIGENSFILDGNQMSPEVRASYTVLRSGDVSFAWEPTPSIDIVNEGYGINVAFMFGEEESVGMGTNYGEISVEFNGVKLGELDYSDDSKMGWMAMAGGTDYPNAFMITAGGGALYDTTTTGEMKVTIPAGALTVSGEPTPEEIVYTWKLVAKKNYTVVIKPSEGETVGKIEVVTVEFPDATTAELFSISSISLRSSDYRYSETAAGVTAVDGAAHPTFKISFNPAAVDTGNYTFSMYAGAFTLDGAQESPEAKAVIKVNMGLGVDNVYLPDANGKYTVVTLSGVVLLKDADASDLSVLPAGIYVINGTKATLR